VSSPTLTWNIAAVATAGVILRPFGVPEAIWAVGGAALLVGLQLLSPEDALTGVGRGADVYLFLTGMMLLAEVARKEGLFDWLAALAALRAKGSAKRLFLLVYVVGVLVTVFLSNDATAVVLTPAIAAAIRAAKVERPLPFLLISAFVANAASFVLPISNPANLVIYDGAMPPLLAWLARYLPASVLAIAATYAALRWTQRDALRQTIAAEVELPAMSRAGKMAAAGIAATAIALLAASALDRPLGLPTAIAGGATAAFVLILERKGPWDAVKGISWGVLPLVAGLFVLVEALGRIGFIGAVAAFLHDHTQAAPLATAWGAGAAVAVGSNLVNNLPAGVAAASAVQSAHVADAVTRAVLIGVDIGPNLSVTGSLATILWLTALRREGLKVSAWTFLKLGALVMPPALILALGASLAFG
jgi:arsenical pump membrane protein